MRRSLRLRLTLWFGGGIALVVALCSGAILWNAYARASAEASVALTGAADRLSRESAGDPADESSAERLEEQRDLVGDTLSLAVLSRTGAIVYQSTHGAEAWPPRNIRTWRGLKVHSGDQTLVLTYPWDRTVRDLRRQALDLLLLEGTLTLFATLGAWWLVGRTLRPIHQLTQQAHEATGGTPGLRLVAPGNDAELLHLVGTLNDLLSRLQDAASFRTRIYAAASHELRTPLQALTGHLEVALQRPRSAEEYCEVLHEAHKQTRRLITLTTELLALQQLETGRRPIAESVDLTAVVQSCMRDLGELASARQLSVEYLPGGQCTVNAPRAHVEILLRNALENAVRHADLGATVRVHISEEAPQFTVWDTCIKPSHWVYGTTSQNGLEPAAESGDEPHVGSGLGLAICRDLAAANGWQVSAAPQAGGVLFSATLQAPVQSG